MRNLTGWIVIGVFVALLVLDAFLPGWGFPTESQWLRDTAWNWNTVPFIGGFLLGHWFGNRYRVNFSAWGYALGFILLELAGDVVVRIWFPHLLEAPSVWRWIRYPLVHAVAGIPVGMFLWGQPYDKAPIE